LGRRRTNERRGAGAPSPRADRVATAAGTGLGCAAVGCLPVAALLFGLFPVYMYARSVVAWRAARDWVEVPCVVVSNKLVMTSVGGRRRRELELVYRYEYAGAQHTAKTLDLVEGRSGYDGAWEQELFRKYPSGTETVCYVDPADPARAVLDRDRMVAIWLPGVPFLLAGLILGVLIGAGFYRQRSPRAARP
jgi:hypothetical protein